jgi:hypothetical protein
LFTITTNYLLSCSARDQIKFPGRRRHRSTTGTRTRPHGSR